MQALTEQTRTMLPHFIIGGAMKCATTTLHDILVKHPEIYIPPGELKFFDADEIELHPDNFGRCGTQWVVQKFDGRLLEWYREKFEPAGEQQCLGEDSPSYLCSEKAPRRIAELIPDVKLIFLLRDPVERAYSHYWHWVRTGRAFFTFEDTLRHTPGTIIRRGFYHRQLQRYFDHFPRQQIHIIIFEKFVRDLLMSVKEVERFLGVAPFLDESAVNVHSNVARLPKRLSVQLTVNRLLRDHIGSRHIKRFPNAPPVKNRTVWERCLRRANQMINPMSAVKPPPMHDETRAFLKQIYAAENEGLSELIGIDLSQYWSSLQ